MIKVVRSSPPLRVSASGVRSRIMSIKLLRPRVVNKVPVGINVGIRVFYRGGGSLYKH